MPTLHNRHHGTAPPDAIYIGRGTPWGNRHVISATCTRRQAVERFERDDLLFLDLRPLRGRDLICSCVARPWRVGDRAPILCHGMSLLREANL